MGLGIYSFGDVQREATMGEAGSTAEGTQVCRIGILGAGRVGTALARQALKAGYEVRIATAKPPAEIALIIEFTAPGAIPDTAEAMIRDSDIIVLAVPLGRYRMLAPHLFAGKIVIDAMNYWAPTDGSIAEFEAGMASSEVVQRHLPEARLVRTLNHIGYHELEEQALPADHPERQALAVAGDDAEARAVVARFVDRLGFDPVDAGPLTAARRFDPGTPIFGGRFRREQLYPMLRHQAKAPAEID